MPSQLLDTDAPNFPTHSDGQIPHCLVDLGSLDNISLRPTVQYKIENKGQNYKFHVVLFVCTNIYK